jgi:hypothetical protein
MMHKDDGEGDVVDSGDDGGEEQLESVSAVTPMATLSRKRVREE